MISYIVLDYDAVKIMFDSHGYTKTPKDTVVVVSKIGMVGSHFLFLPNARNKYFSLFLLITKITILRFNH